MRLLGLAADTGRVEWQGAAEAPTVLRAAA
jgi:hypothetical protein